MKKTTFNKFKKLVAENYELYQEVERSEKLSYKKQKWAEEDYQKSLDKLYKEFSKYNFTEENWDNMISEIGLWDSGYNYEDMDS